MSKKCACFRPRQLTGTCQSQATIAVLCSRGATRVNSSLPIISSMQKRAVSCCFMQSTVRCPEYADLSRLSQFGKGKTANHSLSHSYKFTSISHSILWQVVLAAKHPCLSNPLHSVISLPVNAMGTAHPLLVLSTDAAMLLRLTAALLQASPRILSKLQASDRERVYHQANLHILWHMLDLFDACLTFDHTGASASFKHHM